MGQIVSSAAKPKRCNLQSLSSFGTPAAGEHILVSSDNSMNEAGQGNFDAYVVGDGTKAATALELKPLADTEINNNSLNSVTNKCLHSALYGESLENLIYDGGNVAEVGSTDAILTSNSSFFNVTLGEGYVEVQGQNVSGAAYVWANVKFTPQYGHRYAVVCDMYQATSFKMYGTLSFFNSSDANRGNYSNEYDYWNEGANVRLYDFTDRYSAYAYAGFRCGNVTFRVRSISVFDLGEEGSPYYNLTAAEIIEAYNKRSTYQQYLSLVDGLATEIGIVNEKANTNAENIANVSNTVETNLFDYSDISNDYVERIQNYKITDRGLIEYSAGWNVRVYPVVTGEQYKFDVYNTNQCIAFFDTIPSVGSTGDIIYFGSTNVVYYTAMADGYIGATFIGAQYYVNTYKKGYKFATLDEVSGVGDIEEMVGKSWNNISFNRNALASWYNKYINKDVDAFNRLVVTMCGDSIFGRVDAGSGWNELSPQISYTPDCNDPTSSNYGYQTGHFPPNMWEQIIAYKVLKQLQFEEADVKYFNHSASEVTLTGSWSNAFPLGADSLRVATSSSVGDSATMSFSSAFLKIVYSCYENMSMSHSLQILFSIDGGTSWKNASELGLTCNLTGSNGIYVTPSYDEKFGAIMFKGFDTSKTYIVKVVNNQATIFGLWGFETWNNKRVDVIVNARGGDTAKKQLDNPWRFYSPMSNASLCIFELPYYNDLGTGAVPRFSGIIKTDSATPSNPQDGTFCYCSETGIYTNFNSINAYAGDYIEYRNGGWQKGSQNLDYGVTNFKIRNADVLARCAKFGIPVLCLITHEGTFTMERPFMCDWGHTYQRNLVAEHNLPSADVSWWQINHKQYSGYQVDGVHLNDAGVELYMNVLNDILLPESQKPVRVGHFGYEHFIGVVSSTTTHVNFEFIFASLPQVRVFNNGNITISNITQEGFDVSGSGGFTYEAYVAK